MNTPGSESVQCSSGTGSYDADVTQDCHALVTGPLLATFFLFYLAWFTEAGTFFEFQTVLCLLNAG